MISVNEARQIISSRVQSLPAGPVPIAQAGGCILAAHLAAPLDIPNFPQSSVDGYAIADHGGTHFSLVGESAAGSGKPVQLLPGTAMRIFTGAPVPAGADFVIMQEQVEKLEDQIQIDAAVKEQPPNIRPIGSEVRKGEPVAEEGQLLTPATIGFLAGMGFGELPVVPTPKVGIIITGNELQPPGSSLAYGQVYESSSYALRAALRAMGITNVQLISCKDELKALSQRVGELIAQCDILLVTGGVSVGDYDFSRQALEANGVDILFHRVRQKPGKPLLFGMQGTKPIFGLPGNPASVLSCFYLYVYPALGSMMRKPLVMADVRVPIAQAYTKPAGLTHFLRAHYDGESASLFSGQESYRMKAFAQANALAVIPEETKMVAAGDEIIIHLLPS